MSLVRKCRQRCWLGPGPGTARKPETTRKKGEDAKKKRLRMLQAMVAEKRCLSCHYNAQEGDALGVMDLVLSLDKNDADIASTNFTLILGDHGWSIF